jgi:hypothetical protein
VRGGQKPSMKERRKKETRNEVKKRVEESESKRER